MTRSGGDPAYRKIKCETKGEWLTKRRELGVGASEAPGLLGISPYRYNTPAVIFAEKTGLMEPDREATEAMEWGLLLEDPIAARYAEITDRKLSKLDPWTILQSTRYPWMIATVDRLVLNGAIGIKGPLEIKCANQFQRDEWAEVAPLHFQCQVVHQAIVLGVEWGSLAVLLGGQTLRWCDIDWNKRFADLLIEHESAFWERVQLGDPPPADGSESYTDLLKALYPREAKGKVVALPPEAITWDDNLQEAKALKKKAEEIEREAKNHLIALMGDAETGLLPGGDSYSLRLVEKHATKATAVGDLISSYRELRRFAPRGRP